MASARLHRQSCELGRLPHVCICCGTPATRLITNRFNCEPTWQIVLLPVILLLMLLAGVFTGLRLKRLYNPLAADPIEFPVPVCDAHSHRLSWHRYFLWALLALLLAAMAVLLPTSISIAIANGQGQDVTAKTNFMGLAIVVSMIAAGALLLLSMVLRLITPRVIDYSRNHVDMVFLSHEFVEALQRTNSSLVPGYAGPAMGSPLTSAMRSHSQNGKSVAIAAAALLALVATCCGIGFGLRTFMFWQHKQRVSRLRAEAKERREAADADVKAKPNQTKSPVPVATNMPPPPPPPTAMSAPSAGSGTDSSEATLPTVPAPRDTPTSSPTIERQRQFFPKGSTRFPPGSRQIYETTALKEGMEVWVRFAAIYYRAVVTRVESRTSVRVHYLGWSTKSDATVTAQNVRVDEDQSVSPASTAEKTQRRPDLPKTPSSRTWSDTTGKFKVEATFVRFSGDQVTLRKEDGTEINVPLEKLSIEDQKVVKGLGALSR